MKVLAQKISAFSSLDSQMFNALTENQYGDFVGDAGITKPLIQTYPITELEAIRDEMGAVTSDDDFITLFTLVQEINPLVLIGTRPKKKGPVRGS